MDTDSVVSLLMEAASLMLIGMLFVFSFLGLLILGIHLIARFCQAFPGEIESEPVSTSRPTYSAQPGIDGNIIAAISAAIHTHRQSNNNI
ncbi:OadG family transporter subunit [Alteromonas sp. A081]|uniref:OadG family transporter subunit n=1 Tax=Alteromonas sp. A081 TaxID=3410269 RepID=UPI003B981E52